MGLFLFLNRPPGRSVEVIIEPGSSTEEIAQILAEKKVIDNAFLFKLFIRRKKAENKLQAGKYLLRENMSYSEALKALLKGPRVKYYKITIPEGFTLKEIAKRVAAKTPIKERAFLSAARKDKYHYKFLTQVPTQSLEGYLFPKTYIIAEDTRAEDLIRLMLTQFEKEVASLDFSAAQKRGLSLHQIITVASLIEEEVKIAEERPLVAAVIYNRLNRGMLLQIDATVQYVLPQRKEKLNYDDLKIDSPYNTYLYPGLPPGPISNPGLASIKAALKPAQVDYLYYVLVNPDGHHAFTNSYDEFLRIKRERGL